MKPALLLLAVLLAAAGIIACEASPGVGAAVAADPVCADATAPGDVDGGSLDGEAQVAAPDAGASGSAIATVGPGPVCASGGQ